MLGCNYNISTIIPAAVSIGVMNWRTDSKVTPAFEAIYNLPLFHE